MFINENIKMKDPMSVIFALNDSYRWIVSEDIGSFTCLINLFNVNNVENDLIEQILSQNIFSLIKSKLGNRLSVRFAMHAMKFFLMFLKLNIIFKFAPYPSRIQLRLKRKASMLSTGIFVNSSSTIIKF